MVVVVNNLIIAVGKLRPACSISMVIVKDSSDSFLGNAISHIRYL